MLLIFVPFIIASARRVGDRVRKTTRKGQDKLAEINNLLHETITGIRIVKAFCMEAWEMGRFREAARRLFKANLRSAAAFALNSPMMDAFGAVAIALLILLGRDSIKHGYLSEGFFIAFLIAVFKLYEPVRKFGQFNNNFQQALGASEQIFNFLDAQDEVRQKPDAVKLAPFHRGIQFEHVYFFYSKAEEDREVLHDINLDVKPGEVVAIVGGSGSGKTTLVHLLPRFFDVSQGRLMIDGQDVRDLTVGIVARPDRHRHPGHHPVQRHGAQQHRLRTAGDFAVGAVEEAAKAALAHDFIMAAAARLRLRDRRTRPAPERWRAPAAFDCARHFEERAHPDSRRSHLRVGHRK